MTWYTASVLIAMKPTNYKSGPIEVYENMYLIEAPSSQGAQDKAKELGKEEASIADDGLTIDGVPAVREFVGVRKVVSVSNPPPLDLDADRPTQGTEVTYSLFEVQDQDSLAKLAAGAAVEVRYLE